jgi:hypothetical protein
MINAKEAAAKAEENEKLFKEINVSEAKEMLECEINKAINSGLYVISFPPRDSNEIKWRCRWKVLNIIEKYCKEKEYKVEEDEVYNCLRISWKHHKKMPR